MIDAEKFIRLLARKKVISQELAEGLQERIARSHTPTSAEEFAERLVERGIITKAIAGNILKILDQEENLSLLSDDTPAPKTLPEPPKPSAPKPPKLQKPPKLPKPPAPPSFPADLAEELENSLPVSPVFSSKKVRFKKAATNPWDSKLLLYGAGGILLLLMLITLLYFAIYRRGADEYLNAANAARDSGNYSEAIKEYSDYLKLFPNHTGVTVAEIRLSLSKMRLITDAKSDWPGALAVAKEEIAKIVLQPEYRKEADPELTAMLPTIAENLAIQAKDQKDAGLLADAEEAMLLIQKHVPVSSQPVDRIQRTQVNINFTRREIAKDDRLLITGEGVKAHLENTNIANAYEKMVSLQIEYPGIENDARFVDLLRLISESEKQAVRFIEGNVLAGANTEPGNSEDAHNIIVLANRKAAESNATQSVRNLYVYAAGSVFAVQSTDGKVLWKKTVGGSLLSQGRMPSVIPLPVSAEKEDVLLVDYRTWELIRLDAASGEVRFRVKIGEPFRLAELPPNKVLSTLFLTTESGKCFQMDVQSGQIAGYFQFPQKTNVAPLVDEANQRFFQLAHRTTLYLCPLKESPQGEQPIESLYLGHLPGTIRTAPFLFGPYLLVAQQTGPQTTALQVYEITDVEKIELNLLQTLSLRGAVETAPVIDGRRLFLASNAGTVYLYQWDDDPAATVPLKLLAEGAPNERSGAENDQRSSPRYLGLFGRDLWVSGQELTAYEIQPSRNRLVPLRITDSLTTTLAPLRRIENTVFRTFRYRGQNGTAIKAFALEDGKSLWETQLADPLVEEPTYNSETKTVRAVTQSGKLYQFPLPARGTGTLILDKPVADLESEKRGEPIRALVPLTGGFEAWVETEMIGKSIVIYDPSPSNPQQFRFIPTAEKIQAVPAAFGNGLLTPLRNGTLLFFDPRTGAPFGEPFAVKLSPTEISQWSTPVVWEGNPEFLVLDQPQSVLYRVAAEREDGKNRFRIVSKWEQLQERSDQLLELDGTAFLFSLRTGTMQEISLARMSPGRIHEFGNAISWGPHKIGEADSSQIILATSDRELFSITVKNAGDTVIEEFPLQEAFPSGKPVFKDNSVVFMSHDGTIFQVDSSTKRVMPFRETGVPTELGPFFFEHQTGCVGKDGCLYLFSE